MTLEYALRPWITVKVPEVPATPHAPAAFDPFTDATIPKALKSVGTNDQIMTSVAATMPDEAVPVAPIISFTHTFANVGELDPRSKNTVEDVTSIVACDRRGFINVNVPEVLAAPQAPVVVEPLTDVTSPNTDTVRGGFGDQILTKVALNAPPITDPTAPTDSFTHTFANVGDDKCRSLNTVEEPTSIVACEVFRVTIV